MAEIAVAECSWRVTCLVDVPPVCSTGQTPRVQMSKTNASRSNESDPVPTSIRSSDTDMPPKSATAKADPETTSPARSAVTEENDPEDPVYALALTEIEENPEPEAEKLPPAEAKPLGALGAGASPSRSIASTVGSKSMNTDVSISGGWDV